MRRPRSRAATQWSIDGPPAPEPPAVINRDERGNATVRAMRLPSPLVIDGALDEAPYRDVPAMSDFIQQEPAEGRPASDKTEIWLFYDDKNLYVGARMHEEDPARRVTSDLRRDSNNLYNNDHIAIVSTPSTTTATASACPPTPRAACSTGS